MINTNQLRVIVMNYLRLFVASLVLCTAFALTSPKAALAQCSETLARLVGFTIVAASTIEQEQAQPDGSRIIALQNGMVFQMQVKNQKESFADYNPVCIVFYRVVSQVPMPVFENRLLIDDDLYLCRRIK